MDEFWLSVFRFFAANPMLDPSHHGPIVDFLRHQKFEPSVPNPIADRPGQPALIPAQPNLSMKGRTPESVLRAMREWHRSLAQGRAKTVAASWEPSGFPGFVNVRSARARTAAPLRIVELLTSSELFEEGQAMRHCVASYAGSCSSGRTSIWSLRKTIETGRVIRLATIEVSNMRGTIVQVRGRCNRLPSKGELAILQGWSEADGPALSYWMTV